jgi:hypothetical protein
MNSREPSEGRCFLATYRPLVRSLAGRQAIQEYSLPPFIDGSCRREPDFESPFPSITATCRGGNFAPRLREGDRVAYLTVRGRYHGDRESGGGWSQFSGFAIASNPTMTQRRGIGERAKSCPAIALRMGTHQKPLNSRPATHRRK